ncbi:MAG: hypothetical protein K0Q58_457 [Microbacterium sp.]|nr:hypothetical protein [Microbacterium sp.]
MRKTRFGVLAAGAVLTAMALAGCASSPLADDSFKEKIPAALDSSGLGITESWADKGVDGFSTHVSVGATFDRAEISAADLQQLISIVVEENTLDARYLQLAIEDPDGQDIDIVPLLEQLGAAPLESAFVRISFDEAQSIAAQGAK